MEFILYFIFRRFFVDLKMDNGGIHLEKGPFFRRIYDVPISAVTVFEVKRTLLLRILGGKKVTLSTLSGKVSFYLRKKEPIPFFSAENKKAKLRPNFLSVLLGAFTETRALSGAILFSVTLARIGSVFGSGYYDSIISVIDRTAVNISVLLDAFHIAVPRVTATVAVFVSAAWLFAFVRNILRLSRFTVSRDSNIVICHGLITLYEQVVVPNNLNAAVIRDTAATMLFNAAPVYCHGNILLPPLSTIKRERTLKVLFSVSVPESFPVKPPKRALFGHIAIPFNLGIADAVALVLAYISGNAPVLRSVLWGGLVLCVWYCVMFAVFMRRTGVYYGSGILACSARKGGRLQTVILPQQNESYRRFDRSPFQRFSGMCDVSFYVTGKIKIRIRNISYRTVSGLL